MDDITLKKKTNVLTNKTSSLEKNRSNLLLDIIVYGVLGSWKNNRRPTVLIISYY